MGQEDYLLKEIEKITLMLRLIFNRLTGNEENLAITVERRFEETKEMLLTEINFDLDMFLRLSEPDSNEYLSRFKWNNPENIELLADILYRLGLNGKPGEQIIYFRKALQLYEFCNLTDKTYSFVRESKISKVKDAL